MVSVLPDEALPELFEDLRDLEVQYLKPSQQMNPAQSQATKFSAKVGKSVSRAEFYVDEE